jgi:hypothetical protein
MMKMVLRDEQGYYANPKLFTRASSRPVRLRAGWKTDRQIRHQALSGAYRKPRVSEQPEDPEKAPRHVARGFSYFN